MKTLIVEDDLDSRELAALILSAEGHDVTTARSVAEALALGAAEPPGYDLVVVDLGLPDQDGVELVSLIRRGAGDHVTVLVCSAYAGERHRIQSHEAGCDHFLAKPYKRHQLLEAVNLAALGAERRHREPA